MDELGFWYIVERSKLNTKLRTFTALWSLLQDCDIKQVEDFAHIYLEKKRLLAGPRSFVVSTILNGTRSDESFLNFLDWSISLGKDFYTAMLLDPDALAPYLDVKHRGTFIFEDYSKVPLGVWEEKRASMGLESVHDTFPSLRTPSLFMVNLPPSASEFRAITGELEKLTKMFGHNTIDGPDEIRAITIN